MGVLIKSKEAANNSISKYYGTDIADFSVMLDFEKGRYLYKDGTLKELSLTQALSTVRSASASYISNDGTYQEAPANTPRITYNKTLGVRGLLLESESSNLLTNPRAPSTQTVTITNAVANTVLVLSVYGTGSATISGNVIAAGTATENNPVAVKASGTGSQTFTVTVTGSLSKFQLEKVDNGNNVATSFISDVSNSRGLERVSLSSVLAAKLSTAKTIVCQAYLYPERIYTAGFSNYLYTIIGANGIDKITNAKQASSGGDIRKMTVKTSTSTGGVGNRSDIGTQLGIDSLLTTAIAYDAGGLNIKTAANGIVQTLAGEGAFVNYTNMDFGNRGKETNLIITKFMMFDRKLSEDELAKLTRALT